MTQTKREDSTAAYKRMLVTYPNICQWLADDGDLAAQDIVQMRLCACDDCVAALDALK